MGQFQAGPTMFISEVPVLTRKARFAALLADGGQESAHQRRVFLAAVAFDAVQQAQLAILGQPAEQPDNLG